MKTQIFNKLGNHGLTMIELLITISMIAIVSSVVFSSKGDVEQGLSLQRAVYRMNQDLREVQEMSMGSGQDNCGARNVCGYGIYFGSDSYSFFTDCAVDCSLGNHARDTSTPFYDVDILEVTLEKEVQITDVNPNNLSIVFSPPDPIVYINGVEWNQEATITFSGNARTRDVKINSAGRVEL